MYNMNSNFNGMSHNQMNMMQSQHNFNGAYRNPTNLVPQLNTQNNGNLVHNNIKDNVLCENLEQYTLFIDGNDKDSSIFKNSFEFKVELGGRSDRHYVTLGHPLKNIKYIKLKNVIIPKYDTIKIDATGNKIFEYDTTTSIITDKFRFLVLEIEEINDINTFTSGTIYNNNSFILRYDKNMGTNHHLVIPIERDIIHYKDSSLSNLSRMTIKLCDDLGNILNTSLTHENPPGDDYSTNNFDIYNIITELKNLNGAPNKFTNDANDNNNILESLENLFQRHQIQILFEIGVMENEMGTNINY